MSRPLSSRQILRLELERAALRAWSRLRPLAVTYVTDLGIERGDSGRIAREVLGSAARIHGCDLWPPFVHTAERSVYDMTMVSDARTWIETNAPWTQPDVFFACEILEHMPKEDGKRLLSEMCGRIDTGGLILVSAPLGWMPQGPIDGNPHEVHVSAWEPSELEVLGFVTLAVLPQHSLFVSARTTANVEWRA